MPDITYIIAAVVIAGIITLVLRALPFAILKPLRKSAFVKRIGQWMPAGLLVILAIIMLAGEITARPEKVWIVVVATVVTVFVHIASGRKAVLSIFAGTTCYVALLYFF